MTRCFVVGNGPSLEDTNLDLMKNDISFACNRINLIYPETSWRPTHYVRAEEQNLKSPDNYHNDILEHLKLGCEVWANLWFTKGLGVSVNTIKSCAHYETHYDHADAPHLWHLPLLCTFGSTVNVMIQIAIQKGYKPIYLIGCDLGYVDNKPSHFTPDYEKGIEGEIRPARYANLDTLAAHMVAARSSPVKIYNATVGGELEVYERIDYDTLFG